MEQHICEEEDEEGEGIEDEDVGNVGYASVGYHLHLLFCGAHEEEAGGVEELWGVSIIYFRDVGKDGGSKA